MFEIREFKNTDAEKILSWIDNENAFRFWSADKYKCYPPDLQEMIDFYDSMKLQGAKALVFCDDGKEIGHFILRPIADESIKTVRFGFIIVDSSIRGKGYGKKMLLTALELAVKEFSAEKVTLGVFENNKSALRCYESVGFRQYGEEIYTIGTEIWKCLEMEWIRS